MPSYKASESVTFDSLRVEVLLSPQRNTSLACFTARLREGAGGKVLDALTAKVLELVSKDVVHIYRYLIPCYGGLIWHAVSHESAC